LGISRFPNLVAWRCGRSFLLDDDAGRACGEWQDFPATVSGDPAENPQFGLSLCELFGTTFCSIFGTNGEPCANGRPHIVSRKGVGDLTSDEHASVLKTRRKAVIYLENIIPRMVFEKRKPLNLGIW